MRKTVLLTFVLLVFAAWAVAQQGSKPQAPSMGSPGQGATPQVPSNQTSVQGCLGGSAGHYTVTDKEGKTYRLLIPQNANTTALDRHVGQEVLVTGTMANGGGAASAGAPAPGASGAPGAGSSASETSIEPTKMQSTGNTCSSKTGAAPTK